jgi:hypothetical protein
MEEERQRQENAAKASAEASGEAGGEAAAAEAGGDAAPTTEGAAATPAGDVPMAGADEAALLKDICSAYYLPAWCSIADYARIAESNGLTVRTQTSRESILSVHSTGYSSASMGWALWKPQANFSSTGFER